LSALRVLVTTPSWVSAMRRVGNSPSARCPQAATASHLHWFCQPPTDSDDVGVVEGQLCFGVVCFELGWHQPSVLPWPRGQKPARGHNITFTETQARGNHFFKWGGSIKGFQDVSKLTNHFHTFCCNYPHIDFAFVDFVTLTPVILATLKIPT